MNKNDLIQEIKKAKMIHLFWCISLVSSLILFILIGVLRHFKIEIPTTLSWIALGIYIVIVIILLVIYRFITVVSNHELKRHAHFKKIKLQDENLGDQEDIILYEGVIRNLRKKQTKRERAIEDLNKFL